MAILSMFPQKLDSVPLVFHIDKTLKLSQGYYIQFRSPTETLNDKGIDIETLNIIQLIGQSQ